MFDVPRNDPVVAHFSPCIFRRNGARLIRLSQAIDTGDSIESLIARTGAGVTSDGVHFSFSAQSVEKDRHVTPLDSQSIEITFLPKNQTRRCMAMIIRRFYDWPTESNAFSELNRMRSEMESLFGRLAESSPTGFGPGVFPLLASCL
jgi:hypothetical protein